MKTTKVFMFCIAFFSTVIYSSCCKSCDGIKEIYVSFNKYKKSETDTIMQFKYQPNTNFSILQDSFVLIRNWWSQDTTQSNAGAILKADGDYIIKLPSVRKVFAFSNFQIGQGECGCDHKKITFVNSFDMNGNTFSNTYYLELQR